MLGDDGTATTELTGKLAIIELEAETMTGEDQKVKTGTVFGTVKTLDNGAVAITAVGTETKLVDGTFDGTDQAETTTSLETPGTGTTVLIEATALLLAEIITGELKLEAIVIVAGTINTLDGATDTITPVGTLTIDELATYDGTA